MTNYLSVILIIVTIISCNKSPAGDKRAELDALKKQQAELKEKIITLEEEIAKSDTSSKDDKSKIVSATEMIPQTFIHFIEVQAKVDGDEDVSLSAEMPGTVTAVLVKPGDKVSKGQVLAVICDYEPAAKTTIPNFCQKKGYPIEVLEEEKNLWKILIEKND